MNINNISIAKDRSIRISPRKLNLVAQSVVRMHVSKAINQLKFNKKRISNVVLKVLNAAIANAENNNQYDIDNLYIKEAYVGKSIVLKRFRARAKGRASGIKKPYTNLTIILSENINKKRESHGTKS